MAFTAPSLSRLCVSEIVRDIKQFCYGVKFEDLGRFKYIIGPFDNVCKSKHTYTHTHTVLVD